MRRPTPMPRTDGETHIRLSSAAAVAVELHGPQPTAAVLSER